MGFKEIFRKEEAYLDTPKDLPDLASEKLSDDRYAPSVSTPQQAVEEIKKPEIPTNVPATAEPEIPRPPEKPLPVQQVQTNQALQQQVPLQNFPHHPYLGYPGMQQYPNPYAFYSHPMHYPQQYPQMPAVPNVQVNPHALFANLGLENKEVFTSERRPLMRLLSELDNLESKWHSLVSKKSGLEKEIKYLESDIEHKMKLLRTHLAIVNEGNEVSEGDEFFLADGQVLRSREDLVAVAKLMTKQVFDHHVGPGWNDFEAWVSSCLHDYELAKKLKAVRSVAQLVAALKKY